MIDWLHPVNVRVPVIPPVCVVCNVGGWWTYYPGYESAAEYRLARAALVSGGRQLLADDGDGDAVLISMQPVGTLWIEWLLPMEGWGVGDDPELDWDSQVTAYAGLFTSGVLPATYRGPCRTTNLHAALDFCADLVIRNVAPESWLFVNLETSISVYFHNTSSIGIHAPSSQTPEDLVRRIRVPELHCELFERPPTSDLDSI